MVEILLFAVLSAYLFYRLWSVLGARTGNEKQRNWHKPENDAEEDNIIVMPRKEKAENINKIIEVIEAETNKFTEEEKTIKERFKDFSIERFERGALNAFKAIVQAFAIGDTQKLEILVGDKVYKSFEKAIKARNKLGHSLAIEIKNIEAEIVNVITTEDSAKIYVKFTSDQQLTTKNKQDEIIENAAGLTNRMVDVWTFEKEFNSDDLVWRLIQTESVH